MECTDLEVRLLGVRVRTADRHQACEAQVWRHGQDLAHSRHALIRFDATLGCTSIPHGENSNIMQSQSESASRADRAPAAASPAAAHAHSSPLVLIWTMNRSGSTRSTVCTALSSDAASFTESMVSTMKRFGISAATAHERERERDISSRDIEECFTIVLASCLHLFDCKCPMKCHWIEAGS